MGRNEQIGRRHRAVFFFSSIHPEAKSIENIPLNESTSLRLLFVDPILKPKKNYFKNNQSYSQFIQLQLSIQGKIRQSQILNHARRQKRNHILFKKNSQKYLIKSTSRKISLEVAC